MRFRGVRPAMVVLCMIVLAGACSTTPKPGDLPTSLMAAPVEFLPAAPVSRLHLDEGRYPNLFSPRSHAIWVDDEIAEAKRQRDLQAGIAVSAAFNADASAVSENYIIFECFFESMFPDASIAYDVVGLRNLEVYLLTPEGTQIRPIQRILGSHADEHRQGALRRFSRTNILVFPKTDILMGQRTIARDAAGVRLVVEGFSSDFYFEWAAAPMPLENGETVVAPRESQGSGRLGFSALYSKLRVLAHMFQ